MDTVASSAADIYGSFPVEIIFYIQVETIALRFTCLPMSRVQCLLHLPSLDLVFSTKKSSSTTGDEQTSEPGT